jgi:hypothetical protein
MRRARLEGRHIGRNPLVLDQNAIRRDRAHGHSLREIAKTYRISTATVQRVLKQSNSIAQEQVAWTNVPLSTLYSALAAGFAAMAYLSLRSDTSVGNLDEIGRTTQQMQSQMGNIRGDLRTQRRRLDDLVEYIQPLGN